MGAPAGWFPDPESAGHLRYWDGQAWTGHRAPMTSPTTEPVARHGHGASLRWMRSQMAAVPLVPRFMVVGFTAAVLLGGLVGLVLGLLAYPPTAWFAIFEVGFPAGILGAVLGAFVGMVTAVVRRIHRHHL